MTSGEFGSSREKCPYCGAVYRYASSSFDEEGRVSCQNCGKVFGAASTGPSIGGQGLEIDVEPTTPFRTPSLFSEEAVRVKCPHCGAKYLYKDEHRTEEGKYRCQNCGREIETDGERVVIYETRGDSGPAMNGAIAVLLLIIFLFVPIPIMIPAILCILCGLGVSRATGFDDTDHVVVGKSDQGPSLD
ncbi:hypothetical protein EU546_08420 [Candidatus Thorarchaeota archaeon]|nr:MAG: hypothetical protein EU546_08420 [Candidatus Thorarchaeota archaeon]